VQRQISQSVTLTRTGSAVRVLALAVWAGLITGLLEALWLSFNQLVRHQVIFTSDYILWMTPLLYALLFSVIGIGIAAVVAVMPARLRPPVPVFVFVTLGVLCLFIPVTRIARWAAALVALGFGAQAVRFAAARPFGFRRMMQASLGILGGLALLVFAGERLLSRPTAPGELARSDLPNIVFIVWDTVRSEDLGLYGYSQPTTPGLESLSETSVVFDRAVAPAPWTLPSHASMFTGRWPHELSTGWLQSLDASAPTIAEVLSENGYATGGFVANHHYTSYDSGLDRGFAKYADYRITFRQFLRSSWLTQTETVADLIGARSPGDAWRAIRGLNFWVGVKRANDRKRASEVNDEMLAWLDDVEGRPFFAFLNYFDAHQGYWSPPGTMDRFQSRPPARRAYDAAISYLDGEVTELLEALRARDRLDNTIIVVTSDHGELFGEHGLSGHAHNLYYHTLHVPLLIHSPGRFAGGKRVRTEVTLRDLPATLLELANLDDPRIQGASLSRYWRPDSAAAGEPILAEVQAGRNNSPSEPISRGPMKSVLEDSLQYILYGDGVEELYNVVSDSPEANDLAGAAEREPDLRRLRAALERILTSSKARTP